jgi:hypothetical protein
MMNNPRNSDLAPSWLPRQQRRRLERQLQKLFHSDNCSVCGQRFAHNSRTVGGLDAHDNVVLAGECCASQVAIVFRFGLHSDRHYHFLTQRKPQVGPPPSHEQILGAIAAYQKAIAEFDKQIGDLERRAAGHAREVNLLDRPWKSDDRAWFERNPSRAHRVRMPFPGEADKEAAETPAGHALILLLRQVEPGTRIKVGFHLNAELLPVPDDEAIAHALFEVAVGHEPVPRDQQARFALIEKYAGAHDA